MSEALYKNIGGIRFWNEAEILKRNQIVDNLRLCVSKSLSNINGAWRFTQMEGPILTPESFISDSYTDDDVFVTQHESSSERIVLRAETTPSTYVYAEKHAKKLPVCFWQYGKSFRRELSDGATASKLRFNEFYQLEFQCLFSVGTMADYRDKIIPSLKKCVSSICEGEVTIIESDRLPSYSESTLDIEVDGREVASMSYRNDYPDDNVKVLELAFGLDRLVELSRSLL